MTSPKFKRGDFCEHIVGMPGPDMDLAQVTHDFGDGTYEYRSLVWGRGNFSLARSRVNKPDALYLSLYPISRDRAERNYPWFRRFVDEPMPERTEKGPSE